MKDETVVDEVLASTTYGSHLQDDGTDRLPRNVGKELPLLAA